MHMYQFQLGTAVLSTQARLIIVKPPQSMSCPCLSYLSTVGTIGVAYCRLSGFCFYYGMAYSVMSARYRT
ncbi:hypothetical protein BDR04DRAFT_467985 [Suillus decipiens]|nr:hypothetical protein BDR04DRAFT_467985 [Suillus decipiens]